MSKLHCKPRKMTNKNGTKSKNEFYQAVKKPLCKMQRFSMQILKENYPLTANASIFDFVTACREFKRRENGDSDMKILQNILFN